MEVYVLDKLWQRTTVIDAFESLVWTERWASAGDFELSIQATPANRLLLAPGTALAMNLSYRIMLVETVEGKYDEKEMLVVKGRSLESFLECRVARNTNLSLTGSPKWVLNGAPLDVAESMLKIAFVESASAPSRMLMGNGSVPADTITPIETNSIKWEQPLTNMYEAITTICNQYELGFRMIKSPSESNVFVKVYSGVDRTNQQRTTTFPAIVFSRDLDNLNNVTELNSNAAMKNVAYVVSAQGYAEVYANGGTADLYGLDRRVLLVQADPVPDVTNPSSAQITDYLTRVGKTELGQARLLRFFDGETTQIVGYTYQTDYWLGDIVEIRSIDGDRGYRRVSEQIFVSDAEGERMYPTLAATIVRT